MSFDNRSSRASAIERFAKARRQAVRQQVTSLISGKDATILPFDALRAHLRQQNPLYKGIKEVPVAKVVGSVGRYKEFARHFLPLEDSIRERWVGVDSLAHSRGWPPIELYEVGDAYFVIDGNHRLSVANQLDMPTIEAHVYAFPEDIHIDPEDDIDDVLIRLQERRFMERTGLDQRFPEHRIRFTTPHRYDELLAQIVELQRKLSEIDEHEMDFNSAVDSWYEMIYLPTVQIIRESNLLDEFPGRTEADMFVWLSKHREGLRQEYGDYDNLAELARKLVEIYQESGVTKLARQVKRLFGGKALPPLEETAVSNKDT